LTADLLGDDSTPEAAATAHSAPLWLARMWWEELGAEAARALLAACNEPAEVAMRAADAEARADLVARLRGEGVDVSPAAGGWPLAVPEAMVFAGRVGDLVPILVKEGALTPQSRGSAAVVEALEPRAGETLLDLCAGPGIKTGQIARRMEDRGEIISVELDEKRAAEIAAQAVRLDLHSVSVFEGDATSLPLPEGFDRILLDAPCSDLGTLASRPDARWRKSLRPGGTLVYSTCTISRRENEDRIAALLEASAAGQAPPLELDDLGKLAPELASPHEPRTLQLRPDRDRTTGFFISRLTRAAG